MVVRSIADLRKLPRDRRVNGLLARSRLAVRVPGLRVSDQLRLEAVLNRYQSRCGCTAGAACFLGALVAGGVYVMSTSGGFLSFGFLKDAAAVLAAAFVLGFLAKLVALQVTRWQFSAACRRLEGELSSPLAPDASLGAHAPTGG
jgi:hypothetical protein